MMRVAILDDYQSAAARAADWSPLDGRVKVTTFHETIPAAELAVTLAPFDVIVAMRERTRFDADTLASLPGLKLLITTGMRNASIDLKAAAQQGVMVCGTGSEGNATPEHSWAMLMALCRHIPEEEAALRAGRWQTTLGVDLAGKTLGLVGFGKIGKVVARYARAFDMEVLAWSRSLTDERAAEHGARRAATLEDLLARSEMVSVHVTLNDGTRGLIGAKELAAMQPGALLVNTSRGPIVDTPALIEALESGHLGGAAVDVFDVEPIEASNPILSAPNCLLTPHLGYVTEANYARYYGDAVDDILAWLEDAPVRVLTEERR